MVTGDVLSVMCYEYGLVVAPSVSDGWIGMPLAERERYTRASSAQYVAPATAGSKMLFEN